MNPAAKPQYASIDLSLGGEPPRLHCPVCGHRVVAVEDEGDSIDPCPHLAFVFVGEVSEFDFRSDGFLRRSAGRPSGRLDVSRLPRFLERIGYGNRLLVLELTYGGMACGPVWYTDVYGFDFESLGGMDLFEDECPCPAGR